MVITGYYITCDREVVRILDLVSLDKTDELNIEALQFLIIFHLKSYNLDCFENFKIFLSPSALNSIEEKLYSIFETTNNAKIKLLISLLFMIISVIEEIFLKLKKDNLIKPTSRYIYYYIKQVFNKKSTTFNNSTHTDDIQLIIKVLGFVCENRNFKRIYHIDYFKSYLDIVLLLFHIFHPSFSLEILNVMVHFTYYYDCKSKIFSDKYRSIRETIQDRFNYLAEKLENSNDAHETCVKEVELLEKKLTSIMDEKYTKKYKEDIEQYKAIDNCVIKQLTEFCYLINVIVNLMITNDYDNNISKILNKQTLQNLIISDRLFRGGKFKSEVERIKQYTYQMFLAKMIHNTTSTDTWGETIDIFYINEMIHFYINNHDILHKVLLVLI